MMQAERVLIVGGGPVGVICALSLVNKGIPVTVCEGHKEPPKDPRAATLHPPTLEMLDELGLGREICRDGLLAPEFQFRDRRDGKIIATFDLSILKDETRHPYCIQYEQWKTAKLGYAALEQIDIADIRLGATAVRLEQSGDLVELDVKRESGEIERLHGRYLIGCDGGRSFVRKSLGIAFTGFTYPERFLVLAMSHDFARSGGYVFRNYVMDPVEWCAVFKVPGDDGKGLWRTLFPTKESESDEEILASKNINTRLKGLQSTLNYADTTHRNLYNVHQRVAEKFWVGRCFLAGDAAHVNNPLGGLGLNGGIHDALNLSEKIEQVWNGKNDESVFGRYDRQRRNMAEQYVQEQTIANKKRLEARDENIRQKNMEELRATAESQDRARAWLMRTSLIESVRKAELIE